MMRSKKNKKSRTRLGAATLELAVCLPVMALIVFGSLSGSRMIFLRQACVQSAYETVKESARRNGTQANAIEKGNAVLNFRDLTGQRISFNPANTDNLASGTPITVTVTVPGKANSLLAFGPFASSEITVHATMLKE